MELVIGFWVFDWELLGRRERLAELWHLKPEVGQAQERIYLKLGGRMERAARLCDGQVEPGFEHRRYRQTKRSYVRRGSKKW